MVTGTMTLIPTERNANKKNERKPEELTSIAARTESKLPTGSPNRQLAAITALTAHSRPREHAVKSGGRSRGAG